MRIWKKMLVVCCLLAMMVPAFGCSEEGPMEKAGKEVDQAVEKATDTVKESTE